MADLDQTYSQHAPFSTWIGVVLLFALFAIITIAIVGPAPRGESAAGGTEDSAGRIRIAGGFPTILRCRCRVADCFSCRISTAAGKSVAGARRYSDCNSCAAVTTTMTMSIPA